MTLNTNNWEEYNLKGRVKTIEIYSGRKKFILFGEYVADSLEKFMNFDEKGGLTERFQSTNLTTYWDLGPSYHGRFQYDNNHKLVKVVFGYKKDQIEGTTFFHYNDKGQNDYTTNDEGTKEYEYFYDEKGRIVKEILLGENDNIDQTDEYFYDYLGHLSKHVHIDTCCYEKEVGSRKYDIHGRLIEEVTIFETIMPGETPRLIHKITERYNKQNDIIEHIKEWDGQKMIFTFEYKYDRFGNWTEKKYIKDGALNFVEVREIEYY